MVLTSGNVLSDPDRKFQDYTQRISETSIDGFWCSKIAECSVGKIKAWITFRGKQDKNRLFDSWVSNEGRKPLSQHMYILSYPTSTFTISQSHDVHELLCKIRWSTDFNAPKLWKCSSGRNYIRWKQPLWSWKVSFFEGSIDSGNFMPSGTILKVVQKSPIYIFVMKYYLTKKCGEPLVGLNLGLKIGLQVKDCKLAYRSRIVNWPTLFSRVWKLASKKLEVGLHYFLCWSTHFGGWKLAYRKLAYKYVKLA